MTKYFVVLHRPESFIFRPFLSCDSSFRLHDAAGQTGGTGRKAGIPAGGIRSSGTDAEPERTLHSVLRRRSGRPPQNPLPAPPVFPFPSSGTNFDPPSARKRGALPPCSRFEPASAVRKAARTGVPSRREAPSAGKRRNPAPQTLPQQPPQADGSVKEHGEPFAREPLSFRLLSVYLPPHTKVLGKKSFPTSERNIN